MFLRFFCLKTETKIPTCKIHIPRWKGFFCSKRSFCPLRFPLLKKVSENVFCSLRVPLLGGSLHTWQNRFVCFLSSRFFWLPFMPHLFIHHLHIMKAQQELPTDQKRPTIENAIAGLGDPAPSPSSSSSSSLLPTCCERKGKKKSNFIIHSAKTAGFLK